MSTPAAPTSTGCETGMTSDQDPVGLAEIADLLGVGRKTVDQWRLRGVLPDPEPGTVGGRPWWRWGRIRQWALKTGRIGGSDPRDLPTIYFWYTHDLFKGRVRCDRCGQQSPEPTENDQAIARTQPTWGGYPVTGTQAAMEAWADKHEDECPKVRQWKKLDADREHDRHDPRVR